MRNLTPTTWVGLASLLFVASCSGRPDATHSGGIGGSGAAGTASPGAGSGVSGSSAASAGRGAAGSSVQTSLGGSGGTTGSGGQGRGSTGGIGGRGAAGTSPTTGGSGQGQGGAGQGGVGGQAGAAGGGGSETCAQLDNDYAAAIDTAKMCDARSSAQCQQVVASKLGCYCMTHVEDATTLNAIKARYEQAGCPMATCPGILCVSPGTGACTMINSGDVCN